ncbi:ABC transporter permease subunit [soil metagenome]
MDDDDFGTPLSRIIAAFAGAAGLLILWQIVGATEVFGTSISPPTDVLDVFGDSLQRPMVLNAAIATGTEAIKGFLWGALLAIIAGLFVTALPVFRKGVDQLATIQSAIPCVALAPILLANFERDNIPVAMAASTVFFTIYVAVVSGLNTASPTLHEVLVVFGGSRRSRLMRVQVPSALPVVATSLKVAMPLAIVGAVIGEWFGVSKGIGPVLLTALRNYKMPLMWASATATVVVALLLFGVMALIERFATERFEGSTR